jgi:hypothetical protein
MSAELSTLQTRAVALLEASAPFAQLAVIEISDGTVADRIQKTLLSRGLVSSEGGRPVKPGICCIAGVHSAGVSAGKRLRCEPVLRIAVLENPLTNRVTGGANLHPLDVCLDVLRALHDQPARANVSQLDATARILAASENAIERIGQDARRDLYGFEGGNAYHVNFTVGGIPL